MLVGASLLCGETACSLVYNGETTTQCSSEADCVARGSAFADTTCNEAHLCVKVPSDSRICATNQSCVDRLGGPAICRKVDHKCASLVANGCRVFGDSQQISDDNAIVIGNIVPADVLGTQQEAAVKLARDTINKGFGGGLPPATADGAPRPLIVVSCNSEFTDPQGAARHLIKTVHVPALIGGNIASNVLTTANDLAIPSNVVEMTPTVSAPVLSGLVKHDLIWRLNFSDLLTQPALNPFFAKYLENAGAGRLYADGIAKPGEPIRVAMMQNGDGSGVFPGEALVKLLKFNDGKSVGDNGSNFLRVNFGNPSDKINNPNPSAKYAAAVAQVVAFKPHVIIHVGGPESINFTAIAVERQWVSLSGGAPRPIHIATTLAWQAPVIDAIATLGPGAADMRKRFFGLQGTPVGFDPAVAAAWASEMVSTFSGDIGTEPSAIGAPARNTYDGIFLLAYAIIANGTGDLVGTNVAAGLRRVTVPDADSVHVGTDELSKGRAALASGAPINLVGVSGRLNFDPLADRSPGIANIYCLKTIPASSPPVVVPTLSGFKLKEDGSVVGDAATITANCFP